jgi:hypothetical protein
VLRTSIATLVGVLLLGATSGGTRLSLTLRNDGKGCWDAVSEPPTLVVAAFCGNSNVSPPNEVLLHGGSFNNQGSPRDVFTVYFRGIDDNGLTLELEHAYVTEVGSKAYGASLSANSQLSVNPQMWRTWALMNVRIEPLKSGFVDPPTRREFRLPRPPTSWRLSVATQLTVSVEFSAKGSAVTATIVPPGT